MFLSFSTPSVFQATLALAAVPNADQAARPYSIDIW